MKLNQVVALVKGTKARAIKKLEAIHRGWKDDLLKGVTRSYQPLDEDGERFPDEYKPVAVTVEGVLDEMLNEVSRSIDVVTLQETGNMRAKADITVGSQVLMKDVPVTVLLYLEKLMVDLQTICRHLPTLPQDKSWTWDINRGCFISKEEQTTKTQKRPEVIVKYKATPQHPAQTELVSIDKTIGHWTTQHFSGALPVEGKQKMLKNIEVVLDAIKIAREEANNIEVGNLTMAAGDLLAFVFEGE